MSILTKLKTARSGAAKAGTEARRSVDELRALRVRLLDQRDDVEGRPVPLAEAQDAVASAILSRAEKALDDLYIAPLMRPGRHGPRLDLTTEQIAALGLAASVEGITELISARLEQAYRGQPEAMTSDEQASELVRLDDEILSCELAEESTIRELEAAGFEILRRPDADPRALLAAAAELR